MNELDGIWQLLRIAFAATALVFAVGGLVRGWQMGAGKRPDLLTDWDYEPLPQTEACARGFSRLYLGMGGLMSGLLVLLLTGLRLPFCAGIFCVLLWGWAYGIDAISIRARSGVSA